MNITIVKSMSVDGYSYVELTDGIKSAWFTRSDYGVQICVQNASHKVWRKCGRRFDDFAEALEAYRSPFMKAAIPLAQAYTAGVLV